VQAAVASMSDKDLEKFIREEDSKHLSKTEYITRILKAKDSR